MKTEQIKGCCEFCGFCYTGSLKTVKVPANPGIDSTPILVYPRIKCPHCGKETMNYDNASAVEALNEKKGSNQVYTESRFETI